MSSLKLLNDLKLSFEELAMRGKRKNYPDVLKEKAVNLLNHYSAKRLSIELGLSTVTLRCWQKTAKVKNNDLNAIDFVAVNINESQKETNTDNHIPLNTIKIKLPCDLELVLPTHSLPDTCKLVHTLVQEFKKCSI